MVRASDYDAGDSGRRFIVHHSVSYSHTPFTLALYFATGPDILATVLRQPSGLPLATPSEAYVGCD
jgi:hypothetical protein